MRCYGGEQRFYRHHSHETRGPMKFSVYLPPQANAGKVPVLYFLSGLTCTEETFCIKSHAQKYAAELGLMLVSPDTSPREPRIPGDADHWDFGYSAGFYVDATQAPWAQNYRMYSYVARELPQIVDEHFPAIPGAAGIFGHSMGGHGALTLALRNPEQYKSVSAFCAHCGAHAMSVGPQGVQQLFWRRDSKSGASTTPRNWWRAAPIPGRSSSTREPPINILPSNCCRRNSRPPRRSPASA